jgi:hypothetical protein
MYTQVCWVVKYHGLSIILFSGKVAYVNRLDLEEDEANF